MKKYFENDDILWLIWRWKKPLFIILAISTLVATLISSPLFIKPKYKSFVKVYPSNLAKYSEESPSEQMLQFLESDVIRNQLIKEFNLLNHYDIKEDDKHKINKLYDAYNDNINFIKTKYESVEIEVVDISPDTAFLIASRLIGLYNQQVKVIQDAQTKESVNTLKYMLTQKEAQMDSLEKKLNFLSVKYGILDYDLQVESLTAEYYSVLSSNSSDSKKVLTLKTELDHLEEKGGEYKRLNQLLESVRNEYTKIKIDYDIQKKELLRDKTYANVVVNPFKSDKKVYPVRWLIISVSVSITMILSLGLISFIDRINRKLSA